MEVFRGAMAQLSHCPCMCLHRAEVFDGGLSRGNGTIVPFAPYRPQKIRSLFSIDPSVAVAVVAVHHHAATGRALLRDAHRSAASNRRVLALFGVDFARRLFQPINALPLASGRRALVCPRRGASLGSVAPALRFTPSNGSRLEDLLRIVAITAVLGITGTRTIMPLSAKAARYNF